MLPVPWPARHNVLRAVGPLVSQGPTQAPAFVGCDDGIVSFIRGGVFV
jgi:hypothetical protein